MCIGITCNFFCKFYTIMYLNPVIACIIYLLTKSLFKHTIRALSKQKCLNEYAVLVQRSYVHPNTIHVHCNDGMNTYDDKIFF